MITGDFPPNHDDPYTWPYTSPTHHEILRQMAECGRSEKPIKYPGFSRQDAEVIDNLTKHDTTELDKMLVTIDEELGSLQLGITESKHYKSLILCAMNHQCIRDHESV